MGASSLRGNENTGVYGSICNYITTIHELMYVVCVGGSNLEMLTEGSNGNRKL